MSFLDEIPVKIPEEIKPKKTDAKSKPIGQKEEKESVSADKQREINSAQIEAADSHARVTAVIAGPGTGKTFTLVERIVRLVESGIKPEEITAVTFTVRAAAEMRERLSAKGLLKRLQSERSILFAFLF